MSFRRRPPSFFFVFSIFSKIFVGGLSWDTTRESLKDYFSKYGEVLDANIKFDPATKKSRGFGFVLYSESAAVDRCLNQGEAHCLDGKEVDPKRAEPHQHKGPINPRARKVFIGGLHESISEDMIRHHFSRIGNVGEIEMPIDRSTQKRRGYCFVAMETEDQVSVAIQKRFQEISGYTVEVKKAIPDEKRESRGEWSGRGRGRGGGFNRGGGGGWGGGGGGGGSSSSWGGNPYGQSTYYNHTYQPSYQPSYGGYYDNFYGGFGGGGTYQGYGGGGGYGQYQGYYGGGGSGSRSRGDPYQQGDYSRYGPMRSFGGSHYHRQYPY
ncbi:heterogeneous nuclear ribonucleoprotein D-like isoform X2 [Corticium candelabrum]|uniref:heterogeneous nuclear ribonucleoprotein D-like isoform X2 n=1 Tax=Corticium candelabrum TaxID=121492 RepID=UPI002E253AB3|nr:heterogeneous nuclear ribonucleoprotein D-like isoform X2 [Corticium candelabrum]